jgi:integrase
MFRYVEGVDPVTGKIRRRSVTIEAKSKTAAQAKGRTILAEADATTTGTSATMNQLLTEWMRFQSSRGRSPTTLSGYRSLIDHHIDIALGDVKIGDLTAHHLDSLYSKCSREGRSPRTVRNIHRVIAAALNQGVRWGWLDKNPALRATLPEATPLKMESPSPEQARRLIAACQAKNELLGAFVFLAAVTGCRRGEVAALRWSSFQSDILIISQSAYAVKDDIGIKSTKTGRERVVYLDKAVQDWLAHWRTRCENKAKEWDVELILDGFILSSLPDGSRFVNLDTMSREVRQVANRLGMKSIHLHSLRHFAATELLAAGISARDTAEMLGHADPSLTLKVYAHATTERQRAAAGVLARIVESPDRSNVK